MNDKKKEMQWVLAASLGIGPIIDGSGDDVQIAPEMNEITWMQNGVL